MTSVDTSTDNDSLKLTTRSRHTIMAMVELAQRKGENPVPLSQIALSGSISPSYLEQIFASLRRHGLVKSYRGPGGGYILARPARDIRISDVLQAAADGKSANDSEYANQETSALWSHIGKILHVCLQHVSLEDVANGKLDSLPLTNKLFETFR